MRTAGLNRKQTAIWCQKVTGYRVTHTTLQYWEQRGLLRKQAPGHRVPASYGVNDLVRVRVLAELRRAGAPLQRMRKALRALAQFLPEILESPGAWNLAVLPNGEIVRIESATQLMEVSRSLGQMGWVAMFDATQYVKDAQSAIEEAA